MEPGPDPRHHVTPEAFELDAAVLGRRLATPKRRALALVVDLALAALLASIGGVLVGFAVAIVFFRIATRRVAGSAVRRVARIGFALAGSVLIFATAVVFVEYGREVDDDDAPFGSAGVFAPGTDPEHGDDQLIQSVRLVPFDELPSLNVYPEGLGAQVAEDARAGFPDGTRYLGTFR